LKVSSHKKNLGLFLLGLAAMLIGLVACVRTITDGYAGHMTVEELIKAGKE